MDFLMPLFNSDLQRSSTMLVGPFKIDVTPFRSAAVSNIQLLCDKLVSVLLERAFGDRDILLKRMRTLMEALDRPPSSPEEWAAH